MESYIRNQNSCDIPYESIPMILKSLATKNPDKTAFVFVSTTHDTRMSMTYGELLKKSESFGKGLISLGYSKTDVIGIGDEQSPETLVAIFGVQMIGAIPLLFRFASKDGQNIVNALYSSNCSSLIADPGNDDSYWQILQTFVDQIGKDGTESKRKMCTLEKLILMRLPNSNNAFLTLQNVIDRGTHTDEKLPDVDPESIAVLFFTSGSTGSPKVVPYTHYAILILGYHHGMAFRNLRNERSILYNDRPFSWAGGFPSWVIVTGGCRIVVRNTSVVHSKQNMNKFTSKTLQSEKCTCALLIVPSLSELIADKPCGWCLESIATGGQSVAASISGCVGKLCNTLIILYGSTETGLITYKQVTAPSGEYDDHSVGQPLPGVELKIVSEDGKTVPRGEIGELLVKSPVRFMGYFDRDIKDSISKEGWFKTGDLGHVLENGDVVLDGRKSEVMLIHGKKILPSQLERDIKRHHSIHDAIVSPVPDKKAFHHACVSVVLKPGFSVSGEDLNKFLCNLWEDIGHSPFGGLLTYFPKYYLFLPYFPKTQNGKIDRKTVAAEAVEKLQISNRI